MKKMRFALVALVFVPATSVMALTACNTSDTGCDVERLLFGVLALGCTYADTGTGGAVTSSGRGGQGGQDTSSTTAGTGGDPPDAGPDAAGSSGSLCAQTGGTERDGLCCNSQSDFPGTCGSVDPCSCSPSNSHMVPKCDCPVGECYDHVTGCVRAM